jgi:inhibitor of cysteine peptidase
MKKFIIALMVMLVVLGLAGCNKASAEVKTFTDTGEVIQVKSGEEFIISLPANPTTGYTWEAVLTASWLQQVDKTYIPDEPVLTGSGGVEEFRFKTLDKGSTTITLNYARPWESTAIEQKTFTVEVK